MEKILVRCVLGILLESVGKTELVFHRVKHVSRCCAGSAVDEASARVLGPRALSIMNRAATWASARRKKPVVDRPIIWRQPTNYISSGTALMPNRWGEVWFLKINPARLSWSTLTGLASYLKEDLYQSIKRQNRLGNSSLVYA